MDTSTEQIAVKILTALKEAWERKSSLLKYCTESAFFSQLKHECTINDADFMRGIRFLVERRMIKTVNRKDNRIRFPSLNGLDYLAAYLETAAAKVATDRQKHGWKPFCQTVNHLGERIRRIIIQKVLDLLLRRRQSGVV
jgi:hypothetical protein